MDTYPKLDKQHVLSELYAIELRTLDAYFPKEKKRFSKLLDVAGKLKRKALSNIPRQGSNNTENSGIVGLYGFKTAFEQIDLNPYRKGLGLKKNFGPFWEFYSQFLNSLALEVANADELRSDEKIYGLRLLRDSIEAEALLFNVDMFSHCHVVLNFIAAKIPQLDLAHKESQELYYRVEKNLEADDFYYWPLKIEKTEIFFNALESYKLIAPGQKCTAAFQERFDPNSQIFWIGENRQLIYLLFLLYGNERKFKGLGINEIACHVFKKEPELQARSLNNQLLRIINPNNNAIRKEAIDDSLGLIEELIAPFLL